MSCVYIYIYTYTCIYIYIYTYIHTYTYTYIHTYIYMYIYIYARVDRCAPSMKMPANWISSVGDIASGRNKKLNRTGRTESN